jgi:hypothetical protein
MRASDRTPSPKEFVYKPIDLTPLLEAARDQRFDRVAELLAQGYSLLWKDHKHHKSAIRIMAEEGLTDVVEMIIVRFGSNLPAIVNDCGIRQTFREFLLTEAIDGAIIGNRQLVLQKLKSNCSEGNNNDFFSNREAFARIERYGLAEGTLQEIGPNNEYFLRLTRGGHLDYVTKLLAVVATDERYGDYHISEFVKVILKAVTVNPSIDLMEFTHQVKRIVRTNIKNGATYESLVLQAAIDAAAGSGNEMLTFQLCAEYKQHQNVLMDDCIGKAIICAARAGHAKLLLHLCDYAEREQAKTERFMRHLSESAGAALVNDHVALSKFIMQLTPTFDAPLRDWIIICDWPHEKLSCLFGLIKDYKSFTDIAFNSGLADNRQKTAWIFNLKKEYGLNAMSDEGFNTLVHHPEVIKFLLQYKRPTGRVAGGGDVPRDLLVVITQWTKNENLPAEDIYKFLAAMDNAREQVKITRKKNPNNQPQGNHFFRVKYLVDPPSEHRASAAELECCIDIRKNMNQLINEYLDGGIFNDHKLEVMALQEHLNDAVSVKMIYKVLLKSVEESQQEWIKPMHKKLLKRCLEVLERPDIKDNEYVIEARMNHVTKSNSAI